MRIPGNGSSRRLFRGGSIAASPTPRPRPRRSASLRLFRGGSIAAAQAHRHRNRHQLRHSASFEAAPLRRVIADAGGLVVGGSLRLFRGGSIAATSSGATRPPPMPVTPPLSRRLHCGVIPRPGVDPPGGVTPPLSRRLHCGVIPRPGVDPPGGVTPPLSRRLHCGRLILAELCRLNSSLRLFRGGSIAARRLRSG